ncbi:MAG: response regulator [Parvibaculaceae bacterium]
MPPTGTGRPLSGRRLMLVEDQAIIALDVQTTLSEQGADTVAWANGVSQARALLEEESFDAALLDLHLGSESGLDLLEEFDRRAIPVILMSGYSSHDREPRLRGRPLLEKPYSPELLLDTVLRVLGKSETND